jgi:hypothetical protein
MRAIHCDAGTGYFSWGLYPRFIRTVMAKKNIPRTFYVFVRVEIGLRAHPQIPPAS